MQNSQVNNQKPLLRISNLCDYGIAYLGDEELGRFYRGNSDGGRGECLLRIDKDVAEGTTLDIFVEAMGRINYSRLIHDRKGITGNVELITMQGKDELTYNLKEWQVRLFPLAEGTALNDLLNNMSVIPMPPTPTTVQESAKLSQASGSSPAFYRASFKVKKPGDTYLDMSSWGKGLVWVNGHCLGRFWEVGPQQTLYLPGCWLKKGMNDIVVLDIAGPAKPTVSGLTTPIVDVLHRDRMPQKPTEKAVTNVTTGNTQTTGASILTTGNDAAPGATGQ